jgi:hypothetical protein
MSSYLYYTRQESKLECLRELIKIAKNRKLSCTEEKMRHRGTIWISGAILEFIR